jgi:CsbD-like
VRLSGINPVVYDTPADKPRYLLISKEEAAGKVFGDKKLETEGKTDKAAGKVQNAVGGLKDAVRRK